MVDESIDRLGIVIKTARLHAGMSRKELAKMVHISARHLSSIENSNDKPSYELLRRIIRALLIPSDQIFFPETEHERKKYEKASAMLRLCDDKKLDLILPFLEALLKG